MSTTITTERYRLTRRGKILKAVVSAVLFTVCLGAFFALTTLVLSLYLMSTGGAR